MSLLWKRRISTTCTEEYREHIGSVNDVSCADFCCVLTQNVPCRNRAHQLYMLVSLFGKGRNGLMISFEKGLRRQSFLLCA